MSVIGLFINAWEQFAKTNNGELRITKTGNVPLGNGMSVWHRVYLQIPFFNSEIVFFTGEAAPMKVYFDFKKDLKMDFLIYKEDFIDRVGTYFNLIEEVKVNDLQFDRSFFIKTSDQSFVLNVFNRSIMDFLLRNKKYLGSFKLDNGNNSSILEYNAIFDENDIISMQEVLDFFKEIISLIISFEKR